MDYWSTIFATLLAQVNFILVHAPGGVDVSLHVEEISSIRKVAATGEHHHPDVKCVVVMTNGRFIGVVEPCVDVIKLIADVKK
jgi:hypothetical protein